MESNELLMTLHKRINELSNTNIISVSKEAVNEKTEKIKKDAKANNTKDQQESHKALNSLVDKLIKKFDFEKQEDDFKGESEFFNTKMYKNLMKKYTFLNETDNEPGFLNNKNQGFNNIYQDEKINRVKNVKIFF